VEAGEEDSEDDFRYELMDIRGNPREEDAEESVEKGSVEEERVEEERAHEEEIADKNGTSTLLTVEETRGC
jgi:hypothetical protein